MAISNHPMAALKGTQQARDLMNNVRNHKTTKGAAVSIPAADRKADAAKGTAEPDGSFPINTKADVRKAVDDWGRAGAKASDKAFIIKRARALGALSMLPESWNVPDGNGDADDKAKPKDEVDAALAYVAKRKTART